MLLVKDLLGEQIRLAHCWMANGNYLYYLQIGNVAVNMCREWCKHSKGKLNKVGRFLGCENMTLLGV